MMAGGSAAAPAGNVQSLHPQGNNVSIQSLKSGLLDTLQSQRHSGLDTNLQSILALVSGALFATAILVLAAYSVSSSESDSPYAPGFFWSAVGCAGVYVLTRFVSSDLAVGATTAFVPLAATSILFLFGQSLEEGKIGLSLLLLGLAYAAAWALPILRGRPALLASALLSTGTGIVILMMQSSITRAADCSERSYSNCYDDPSNLFNAIARQSSTLFLIIGIGLLAVAWTLDRKDWPMLGRVFIGVGIYFEGIGAFGVLESSDDRTAGSILLAIAGVLLVLVAVQRSRKTSLIIGGIGAFSGIIAFVTALTSSNESPAARIFLLLLISAGLGFLCIKKSAAVQAAIQSIGKP